MKVLIGLVGKKEKSEHISKYLFKIFREKLHTQEYSLDTDFINLFQQLYKIKVTRTNSNKPIDSIHGFKINETPLTIIRKLRKYCNKIKSDTSIKNLKEILEKEYLENKDTVVIIKDIVTKNEAKYIRENNGLLIEILDKEPTKKSFIQKFRKEKFIKCHYTIVDDNTKQDLEQKIFKILYKKEGLLKVLKEIEL